MRNGDDGRCLKQAGTMHSTSEVLKMSLNTGDSWSAQCLRVERKTESGPVGLLSLERFVNVFLQDEERCDGGVWAHCVEVGTIQAGKKRCDSWVCGSESGPLSNIQ